MNIEDISQPEPKLQLESFFDGKTYAWGIFEDRFGVIRRQFQVEIDGHWNGETLTLNEYFLYNDGERDTRIWQIQPQGQGQYRGTAADVIGEASGQVSGNTLNWQYQMDLKVGDGAWRVRFDDWMVLQPGGVLLNRAYVKKYGVTLGTVTLSFQRADALQAVPFSLVPSAVDDPISADVDR